MMIADDFSLIDAAAPGCSSSGTPPERGAGIGYLLAWYSFHRWNMLLRQSKHSWYAGDRWSTLEEA
jgi:hypothetical protein